MKDEDLELAEQLRTAIGDLVRRVRAHNWIPQGQAAVLGHLDRTGPASIADLARLELVKHQSMTRTVHLLHDQGHVALEPHPQDGRQLVVTVTPQGRRALDEERRHRAEAIARALRERLTADERRALRRVPAILRKLQP